MSQKPTGRVTLEDDVVLDRTRKFWIFVLLNVNGVSNEGCDDLCEGLLRPFRELLKFFFLYTNV